MGELHLIPPALRNNQSLNDTFNFLTCDSIIKLISFCKISSILEFSPRIYKEPKNLFIPDFIRLCNQLEH